MKENLDILAMNLVSNNHGLTRMKCLSLILDCH